MSFTPLDLARTPLEGKCLIEAGAGTGKTYTIAGIFLRLILEANLRVDQILVVTFTIAATAELKDRIRRRLASARHAFQTGKPEDPLTAELFDRSGDRQADLRKLQAALTDFDRSAVYTIHGFCQHLLFDHAFETGSPFDLELLPDASELIREAAEDFWRKEFFSGPPEWLVFARQSLKSPEALAALFREIRSPDRIIVPEEDGNGPDLEEALSDYRKRMRRLRPLWGEDREAIRRLLLDPGLKGNIYGTLATDKKPGTRNGKLSSILLEMDRLLDPHHPGFPLFDRFPLFTSSKIDTSTKIGSAPPDHPFFDACQDVFEGYEALRILMARRLVRLKRRFLETAATHVRRRKLRDHVLCFDDLLLRVRAALAGRGGDLLARAVRERLHAALVDEFQDTDPVQYEIFSRLFGVRGRLLYMIGDPKQAIYSFRGADLFSYLKAAAEADHQFTLLTNWRSSPALVQAVNTIFSRARNPFLFRNIGFSPAVPCPDPPASVDGPALVLWTWPEASKSENGAAVRKNDAVERICRAIAVEILRLVRPGDGTAGGCVFRPCDIAVLTRTHDQAYRVRRALTRVGIPSVLYDAGGVLQTHEAVELERLLRGVAEPGSDRAVRAALSTSLLAVDARDFDFSDVPPEGWEDRISRLFEYHEVWKRQGFMPMFRLLLDREGIAFRLLEQEEGERRLTNLMHLAELLHAEGTLRRPGLAELMRWFGAQRTRSGTPEDEQLIRLESDASAVTVVTIHRSKGLEYEVVFSPFLWGGSELRGAETPICHDPENDYLPVMDLGSDHLDRNRSLAEMELLAENLRLMYVAVTRAARKCYIAWDRFKGVETSAPAYLLHLSRRIAADPAHDVAGRIRQGFRDLDDDAFHGDLAELAGASGGTIEITELPSDAARSALPEPLSDDNHLRVRKRTRRVLPAWQISSYSALAAARGRAMDFDIDRDGIETGTDGAETPSVPAASTESANPIGEISGFPAGTRSGLFFHEMLENIEFKDVSTERIESLVADGLRRHGLEASWQEPVCRTLRHTLLTPLEAEGLTFTLSEVARENRLAELAFTYPMNPLKDDDLKQVYRDHPDFPGFPAMNARLEELSFFLNGGFMKGFIDLVIRHSNRYFILDWKSNLLGEEYSDYSRPSIERAMGESGYCLQYHLYTVALHRWLGFRVPGYRYRRDFGGVFYLFIRGMHPKLGSSSGVFFDRPGEAFIEALDRVLTPGPAAGSL
ncbi:MAG: exodeoxyribonuclease V subunit beta [Desulfobacterales bacterium]